VTPRLPAFLTGLLASLGGGVMAQQFDLSGSVGTELRYFTQSPAWPGQSDQRLAPSLTLSARLSYDFAGGSDRLVFSPYLRADTPVEGRAHADLREAYWLHQGDGWSLTAGIDKVFWGVTESRYLVDIVNQDDMRENLVGGEKLGQPMVNLSFYNDWGNFGFYVLPLFRPRDYRDFGSRLTGPLPIGDPVYTSPKGRNNIDYALRWSQNLGGWDLGLSYFRGTGREPRLVPSGPNLVPIYDQIDQIGLDVQFTSGAWLWKLEAIDRGGQGPRIQAVTGGFEWTLSGLGGLGADLGLIAEWNYDGRDPVLAPATWYDNDLFLGGRITLNDFNDTSLLIGALIDRDTNARIGLIEGQRRIGENLMLAIDGALFAGGTAPDPVSLIGRDDFLQVSLRWFF
jgi:hypothetical protein